MPTYKVHGRENTVGGGGGGGVEVLMITHCHSLAEDYLVELTGQ